SVKHLAGRLLKQPAREGVVAAPRRLVQLMCRHCATPRDRRIGPDLPPQPAPPGAQPAPRPMDLRPGAAALERAMVNHNRTTTAEPIP
ncbi:hypothetical protein B1218_38900, partial [Pseudomonas ogarae]